MNVCEWVNMTNIFKSFEKSDRPEKCYINASLFNISAHDMGNLNICEGTINVEQYIHYMYILYIYTVYKAMSFSGKALLI